MYNQQEQLSFIDLLSILSFVIGLMNLNENITQGDIQQLQQQLSTDIHDHLQQQDIKLDEILKRLENTHDS